MLLLLSLIITLVYSLKIFNNNNYNETTFKSQNYNSVFQIIDDNGDFKK